VFDLRTDGRDLTFVAGADAWIEIRESRQSVAVGGASADEIIEIPRPLRFGSHWIKARRGTQFHLTRVYPGNADGSVAVAVHCSESPEFERRIAWLRQVGAFVARIASQSDPDDVPALLAAAEALARGAANPTDAALALHLKAQAFAINGRNTEANEAFATAEAAWTAAGNSQGAFAAHLGRVDGLQGRASYAAVLELTADPANVRGPQPYLFVRAENARCLALQYLGRLEEAQRCFEWTLASYRRLREPAETAVALQAYAGIRRDLGDFEAAQRFAEQSLREAVGPDAALVRGRNLLTLADLSLRRGDVALSLRQLDEALQQLTIYRDARWQANVYMKLADLYGELGSYDEAYAALTQAVQRLSARDNASRLATAILTFADLERHSGLTRSALLWATAAESMMLWLHMTTRADAATVLAATLRVDGGDLALREIPSVESVPAEDAGKWRLVRARVALAQNRGDDARAELDQLERMPLSLTDRVQARVLHAELQANAGDAVAAQETLFEAAAHIGGLAQRSGSDVLRYVIARQIQELRRMALRIALEQDQPQERTMADVWLWLGTGADDNAPETRPADNAHNDAFDRAVASELLNAGRDASGRRADAGAQRELLASLAVSDRNSGAPSDPARLFPLTQFQASLPEDAAFVAYVDGGSRGALVWLSRSEARLLSASAPERVRADAGALLEAAKDAGTPLTGIAAAARAFVEDLFAGRTAQPPPRRLYVLADPMLRGIPWSVLTWPGAAAPLVETTTVTMVRLSREVAPGRPVTTAKELHLVVSSQREAGTALPVLAGAEVEGEQIRAAVAGREFRVVEDRRATRNSIDRALAETGGWVHVAAHGVAEPQRIGYAGLWLEPVAPETSPAFLSWIDVLDRGVRSDLVVLDACQTGDSGTAVNGNLSFADAVARAGARRVVAAMWPVSDAASATWVPAFYAELLADEKHDVGDALRNAQQRLRASRAFSHPFYWAGMQTIERWPIGVSASR
jgi:tetratricopeptide (TPR) repeat protein